METCKAKTWPIAAGLTLNASYSVPDFILGEKPIASLSKTVAGYNKTELVGELKSRVSTMYGAYISPGKQGRQLNAIIQYAKKHTTWRTAVFITIDNDLKRTFGGRMKLYLMNRLIGAKTIPKGVIPVVVTLF